MMSSINIEYEDRYHRGCTLIWDSGRLLSGSQRNGSKRKVYLIEGNFLQKSRVLSKIKYFESKDTVVKISKSARKVNTESSFCLAWFFWNILSRFSNSCNVLDF